MDITTAPTSPPARSSLDGPALDGLALAATGLTVRYGDFTAVDDIDLHVARGELFALLGTNGAGKTTTIETLVGQRRRSAGTVQVLGRDPARSRRALARHLGVMLQEPGLPDDLSPAEVLKTWKGLNPRAHGDVGRVLDDVGLGARHDARCSQLSGGERRRLELAIALLLDPTLLFLDEPTTGMDPTSRETTWDLVRALLRRGTTVVLTTHHLEEAEALADHLAIMHQGRIAVTGTLEKVLGARPARIRLRLPTEARHLDLPRLTGQRRSVAPGSQDVEITTTASQQDLHALLNWADAHRITFERLSLDEASLAEVFREVQRGTHPTSPHTENQNQNQNPEPDPMEAAR